MWLRELLEAARLAAEAAAQREAEERAAAEAARRAREEERRQLRKLQQSFAVRLEGTARVSKPPKVNLPQMLPLKLRLSFIHEYKSVRCPCSFIVTWRALHWVPLMSRSAAVTLGSILLDIQNFDTCLLPWPCKPGRVSMH